MVEMLTDSSDYFLAWGFLPLPRSRWIRVIIARIYRKVVLLGRRVFLTSRTRRLATQVRDDTKSQERPGITRLDTLGLEPAAVDEIRRRLASSGEVLVARIDQDGRLLSEFGPIPGTAQTTADGFTERIRFNLDVVVLSDEVVGVRKSFRGNQFSFMLELEALCELGTANLNVPTVLDVDVDTPAIVMTFLAGRVLSEAMALRGALLRDCDVALDPRTAGLPSSELWLRRLDEGRRLLPEVVGPLFVEQLFELLSAIHAQGFLVPDIKYGNVIIGPDGKPWLFDFDVAARLPWTPSSVFRTLRELDIEKFNLHYGTDKPTGLPATSRADQAR